MHNKLQLTKIWKLIKKMQLHSSTKKNLKSCRTNFWKIIMASKWFVINLIMLHKYFSSAFRAQGSPFSSFVFNFYHLFLPTEWTHFYAISSTVLTFIGYKQTKRLDGYQDNLPHRRKSRTMCFQSINTSLNIIQLLI